MLKFRVLIILSPPFEGGVAGTLDYLILTRLIPRPGWLIYFFLFTFISMTNKNFFKRKDFKFLSLSLRNRSTFLRGNYGTIKNQKIVTPINTINHPGRKQSLQYFDCNCAAVTPPLKGGETFLTFACLLITLA